jgi:hypothetical protein
MRHQYRPLASTDLRDMERVKDMGLAFWIVLDKLGDSRELSLAKSRIEEAVMWATKHITR